MDVGTPPFPVVRQIDGWMEGQTRVKTLLSRRTTYAGGNKIHIMQEFINSNWLYPTLCRGVIKRQSLK